MEKRGQATDDIGNPPIHAVVITCGTSSNVEMEAALEAARKEAGRANFAKCQFLSRMSHELRTPLNSVLGFAQILQMEVDSPSQFEMIDLIHCSGIHLVELINAVLDSSQVESNTFEVLLESVDLTSLI